MMPIEVENTSATEETQVIDGSSTLDPPFSIKKEKKQKKRSEVWKHFERLEDNRKAKCHYCTQNLSFGPGSVSNLLRHLRKKHPAVAENFRYQNNSIVMNESNVEMDGTNEEDVQYRGGDNKRYRPDPLDVESIFRRDHSYVERGGSNNNNNNNSKLNKEIGVFGQFVESELTKFQSELRRRQCKRELLKVLMHHQEMEDKLYSSTDSITCPGLRENGNCSPRAEVFFIPREITTPITRQQTGCDTACLAQL